MAFPFYRVKSPKKHSESAKTTAGFPILLLIMCLNGNIIEPDEPPLTPDRQPFNNTESPKEMKTGGPMDTEKETCGQMAEKHYKPAFERADPEKKKRVISTAIDQFGTYGFEKANINVIAKKAGISVGLIYKYFDTKEDLFITCMNEASQYLDTMISGSIDPDGPMADQADKLIRTIRSTSGKDSAMVKFYNEITKQTSDRHAEYFSDVIEGISFEKYYAFLKRAQDEGKIRDDCDVRLFAFFFDSILMMLQFSYTCDYYRERFKVYCGEDIFERDEDVVEQLVKFLESAFAFSKEDLNEKDKKTF